MAFQPTYSYAKNYISDLGLPACGAMFEGRPVCSPLHALVNADFVVQGLLFVAAGLAMMRLLTHPARWALLAAALANGIGISLVGLVPENAVPPGPHALGALLAIVGGNATALASAFAFGGLGLPRVHRTASLGLPFVAAVALAMLAAARARGAPFGLPDGVWERTSVYTITTWELLTAWCLLAWSGNRDGVVSRG